jgi:hypothetical protein
MLRKKGRPSKDEIADILEHKDRLTLEELAERTGRTERWLGKFLKANGGKEPRRRTDSERSLFMRDLKASQAWKRLKEELTTDELAYFEESYINLVEQFRGDIFPTEQTQILDAIKFEILKSRNLVERRKAKEDIKRLERQRETFLRQFGGDVTKMASEDRDWVLKIEQDITAARAAEQSRTTEFVKLQERHDSLMKQMKATRDQRIKEVESSRENFLGVVKDLQKRDVQEYESRQLGLAKLAAEKEYKRLGSLHQFEDKSLDRPILSCDTVDQQDEGEGHEAECKDGGGGGQPAGDPA